MVQSRFRGALGVVLVALILTVAMAAPVLWAPGSRLFGSEIVGRHEAPFIVANQFEHPRRPGLYTQPVTDYFGALVARVTGDGISAYNVVVLATFPLAALFAYLLAFRLTGTKAAAALAGLLYAFAPIHVAQSAYHPHGAQIQWLPLYFLAVWLSLEQASRSRLVLVALALALVALSSFYYGLMAIVLTPFCLVGFWIAQTSGFEGRPKGLLRTLAVLAGMAGAGVAYVLAFAPAVLTRIQDLAFPRSDLGLYGARWWSYLLPPVGHPLAAARVEDFWERVGRGGVLEQQATLGFGLLALAAIAVAHWWTQRRSRELAAVPALVLISVAALLFSLAPAEATDGGTQQLLRPAGIVHNLLPMFRAFARFGVVVFLAVAILASAGATALLRTRALWSRAVGVALVALALVELAPFPPFRWRDVLPTSAHRFLSDGPEPARVLDCASPPRIADHPGFQRFAHEIALPSGNSDCGDPGLANKLAQEGFTHILVRRPSALGAWLIGRSTPRGWSQTGGFEDALLFELAARPPAPYFWFSSGFSWREFRDNESYRWMSDSGLLTVVNPTGSTLLLQPTARLHSFPDTRTMAILLDRVALAELEVTTRPEDYELPEIRLSPGAHSLNLRPTTPAVVADSLLGNGDYRPISIAIWDFKLQ
ncbi:MAG: 6-pyruvoyl-tetrahydropterin synthase-related protein [Thermoanaerobaculia bacterium]